MSNKKKINVYIVTEDILDEENYIFNQVYVSIWNKIKQKLNDKYIFIEKNVKPDYKKYLKELSEYNYDILISGLNITQERIKNNYFTTPIYITRPCVLYPLIAINYYDFFTYLKFYSRIWIKPFAMIVSFFVLITILDVFISKNMNFQKLLKTNSVLIGNVGYLNTVKKNSAYVKIFIIAIVHLFLMHFIFAYTTSLSVKFITAYDSMDLSIKNKKILVAEGTHQDYQLVKQSGGIPVIISQQKIKQFGGLEQYYLQNKNKAEGVFMGFLSKKSQKLLYSNQLKKSNYYFGSYYNGYAINKKNKELLIDINEEIHKLKINGDIKIECETNDVPSDIVIC